MPQKVFNDSSNKSNGYGTNSEGSSSASRFYDNGADTTSSLSDTYYSDNATHKQSPHMNGKSFNNSDSQQIGFTKLPFGAQTSTSSNAAPVANQRSSC